MIEDECEPLEQFGISHPKGLGKGVGFKCIIIEFPTEKCKDDAKEEFLDAGWAVQESQLHKTMLMVVAKVYAVREREATGYL